MAALRAESREGEEEVGGTGHAVVSAIVYIALTLVIGRQVVGSVGNTIAIDLGDSMLNAGVLAWNAQHLPWSQAWPDFPGFSPVTGSATFTEHLVGVSLLSSPIFWASHNPFLTYNVTLLLTFPASALAMHALTFHLTRSAAAAFLAGLAFGFAPYRVAHLPHIQMLAVFWAPLALLGLHRFLETRSRYALLLFAVCWALQAASNGYLLVYFTVLVGLWILWFVVSARRWRDLAAIAAAAAVAFVPLVPILYQYVIVHARHGFSRSLDEVLLHGADLAAILCAPADSTFWSWLRIGCGSESELFPGITLMVIAGAGMTLAMRRWRRVPAAIGQRSVVAFYALAGLVMWSFSWGPRPTVLGDAFLPAGPFASLMHLPGVNGLRVPARFWMMVLLCGTIVMALAMADLFRRVRRPWSAVLPMLVAAGLLIDGFTTMRAVPAAIQVPDASVLRGGLVLELPIGDIAQDAAAQLRAVVGGWTTVNGYSGYAPAHYAALRYAARENDAGMFEPFTVDRDLHVLASKREPRLARLVERQPGVELIGSNDELIQYRLPRRQSPPPATAGDRLEIATVSASCLPDLLPLVLDEDRRTRWQCGPQLPGQEITADLGTPASVAVVVPALGEFSTDFPRHLVVETSIDGISWQPGWDGSVVGPAVAAGIEDPLHLRLTLAIPPRSARYVRLRQTGRDETWYWSIAELEIRSSVPEDQPRDSSLTGRGGGD